MRMYPALRIGIAICLFLSVRAAAQDASDPYGKSANEAEYEVFSAYLAQSFIGPMGEDRVGDPVSQIVIVNSTETDKDDVENDDLPPGGIEKYLRREAPSLRAATIWNFHQANVMQAQLARRFHLPIQYQLVSAKKIGSILKDVSSWPEYYRQYPGAQGYVALSRVGFSADKKQALFYASNSCGGTCGTGSYVVMEKYGLRWKILKEVIMWVS